jgi:hypothetical protein
MKLTELFAMTYPDQWAEMQQARLDREAEAENQRKRSQAWRRQHPEVDGLPQPLMEIEDK